MLDVIGRRQANNATYYRFSFQVGRFGVVRRRKTRFGRAFQGKQCLKIFYSHYTEKLFRALWKQARHKRYNLLTSYVHIMERRLDVIVFRTGVVFTVLQARLLIELGSVFVNGKIIHSFNYTVGLNSIIRFVNKNSFIATLMTLFKNGVRPLPPSSHLVPNYQTGTFLYRRATSLPVYTFPFSLEQLMTVYH